MVDREKVIKGLETCYFPPSKCEDCPYHGLPDEQSCNDVLCMDALALLKEQKDMIQIQTVAEYLAQYTAPPVRSPLAVYGDLVKAWERFLDGLRKRENKND